jgi:hypothetical protein
VADINLTQEDADALLAMEKHKVDDTPYEYPSLGGGVRIPLQSLDKRESFFLDITRSQIVLTKGTYQNRARGVAILARLDFGGAPHRNPMIKRSRVRICTCIAKGTEIDGRFRCQPSDSATLAIPGSCC